MADDDPLVITDQEEFRAWSEARSFSSVMLLFVATYDAQLRRHREETQKVLDEMFPPHAISLPQEDTGLPDRRYHGKMP
jgi:hypothetical protein